MVVPRSWLVCIGSCELRSLCLGQAESWAFWCCPLPHIVTRSRQHLHQAATIPQSRPTNSMQPHMAPSSKAHARSGLQAAGPYLGTRSSPMLARRDLVRSGTKAYLSLGRPPRALADRVRWRCLPRHVCGVVGAHCRGVRGDACLVPADADGECWCTGQVWVGIVSWTCKQIRTNCQAHMRHQWLLTQPNQHFRQLHVTATSSADMPTTSGH